MIRPKDEKKSIYKHMLRGSAWAVGMRWGIRAIGLISVVILARLLSPDDFGIVATGALTIGFISGFAELGAQTLLIRDRNITDEHCNTAWTIKILQGLAIALVMILIAPVAGRYFNDDRVIGIIGVLALSAVFEGVQNIGMVLARKELDFSRDFRFHIYLRIASFFITIFLAWYLRSYWALVWGQVIASFVGVPLSYAMHPYRPRLCLVEASRYLRFASAMIPLRVGRFLNGKADALVVGGIATTAQLGLYNVASDVSAMLTKEILTPIGRGLMPNYSKLNHDPDKLAEAYCQVLGACGVIVFPFGFGLWAVAKDFVGVLLGPQWGAAVPVVEMLSLYFTLAGLMHMMSSQILVASGHERRSAILMWIRLAILVPCVAIAAETGGFGAVAPAATVAAVAAFPVIVFALTKSIPVTVMQVFMALWRPTFAAGLMALGVRFLVSGLEFSPFLNLLIAVASGAAIYFGVLLMLWTLAGQPKGLEKVVADFFYVKILGRT